MKTYKLTRPFDDGTVVHPRGGIVALAKAPKSAKEISAEEIAAEKTKTSVAEDAVRAAERADLKAEIMAELAEAGLVPSVTKAEATKTEVDATNAAAAAAITGGVDNDGKPLKETPTGKAPVQKAGAK